MSDGQKELSRGQKSGVGKGSRLQYGVFCNEQHQKLHLQDSLFALLAPHFPIDPRRLTVLTALILATIDGRTVCVYQLVSRVRLPGGEKTLYQRLKRFIQFDWPDQQHLIAAFILSRGQKWQGAEKMSAGTTFSNLTKDVRYTEGRPDPVGRGFSVGHRASVACWMPTVRAIHPKGNTTRTQA